MYEFNIWCEISKGTIEIPNKILIPYTAKYAFYCLVVLRVSYDIFLIATSLALVRRDSGYFACRGFVIIEQIARPIQHFMVKA